MTSSAEIGITTRTEWDHKWQGIFDHYQQDTRHAFYINALLETGREQLVEIGAGSFRDVACLNRLGVDCHGSDYSSQAVELAQSYYPELANRFQAMDAFSLTYADKSFDLSYHNGFWVLFDDASIQRLLCEQARVTRHTIVATVHNAHNHSFHDYFQCMSQSDPLFRIRFFEMEEMMALMQSICREIYIIPVGKGKKYHEDLLINRGKAERPLLNRYFRACGHKFLKNSERLMCIGKLQ